MRRLFIALDLPETLRDGLLGVAEGLGIGREVEEENLHLTLAFLDAQADDVLEPLHEGLSDLRLPQVRLQLQGLEVWGGKSPNALVMLAERVPELLHLQEKVAQVVRGAGIDLPRRRFKPHVTLVRFQRGLPPDAQARLAAFVLSQGATMMPLEEGVTFSLYQSTLTADGPIYEALASYGLQPI
ncbi:RNA 2',3'-cyclic phosphodiesterase [Thalassovita mediterranea]|jgi:2'-5' RNA ligase|uniref:RNA 2',3'-cyclic phosphodiesterase n=1 Tax=Thalassovita mediterranea TaxID=340021 RepID=A0A0P1GNV8_9RHOB|nr:RNA 2',3'-cyclic phosphodiesterase [Thalassovita mediterranea]CUH84021.1 2'-5' RNA ligase [Thalassovita mediterranea]SIS27872.1 2'-5' RNA ligase [Thalassovita mediterranea]